MKSLSPRPWHVGPPGNGFLPNKRYTDQKLFGGLGMTPDKFETYSSLFLQGRLRRKYAVEKDGWPTVPHMWNHHLILRHLAGLIMIGLFWAESVRTLMLDFDTDEEHSQAALAETVSTVIRSLPGEWAVYRSSDSGGIRALAFLDRAIKRTLAQKWLIGQLRSAGYDNIAGTVEARMDRKPDRLPFGVGSMLLDSYTLEPIYHLSLPDSIAIMAEYGNDLCLESKTIVEWCAENNGQTFNPNTEWDYRVRRLLAEGLYPEIHTYLAVRDLTWRYRVCEGKSENETVAILKKWIREHHNDLSRRVNTGQMDKVDAQIEETGRRFDPSKVRWDRIIRVPSYAPPDSLKMADLRQILTYPFDYKEVTAAWYLLAYCKANLRYKTTKKSKYYVPRNSSTYYVPRNSLKQLAAIPVKALRNMTGFTASNTRPMMQKLCQVGLFELWRDYHPDSHSCRQYEVNFPFSGDDSPIVGSLDNGLAELMSKRELRDRFGPYYANKILAAAGEKIDNCTKGMKFTNVG